MKRLLPNNTYWLLFAIILLFCIQEAAFIKKRVTVDEIWHSVSVYRYQQDGLFTVSAIRENGGAFTKLYQLAGYQASLIIWHKIFPESIIFSRIFSMLFAILILLLLFALSRRLWGDTYWALIPVSLLAADNIFFITAITVRSDIIIAVGPVLLLFFIYDKNWTLRPGRLLPAGIISLILCSMHPNYILAVIGLVISYLVCESRKISFWQNIKNLSLYLSPFIISVALAFIAGLYAGINAWEFALPYFQKKTYFDLLFAQEFGRLYLYERDRYLDFIQFPFRLHLFILLFGSIIISAFSKEKIIRFASVMILTILVLFILLDTKGVRYFILILPLAYILLAYQVKAIYARMSGGKTKALINVALSGVIIISLAGNIYLMEKHWNTNYSAFARRMEFQHKASDKIIGDLVLWNIYKDADYDSFSSKGINLDQYDYMILRYGVFDNDNQFVLTHGNTFSKDLNRESRNNGYKVLEAFVSEKGTLLKEVNNPYYGSFHIYKIKR